MITRDGNGENMARLELTEAVLVDCNIANTDHQRHSRVLYKFGFNKSFGQLLDILPKILYF